MWVVYLVRCADGSLYCGVTNDMAKRLKAHNKGKGAKYTRSRGPIELVAASHEMSKSDALKLEHRVKKKKADRKIHELTNSEENLTKVDLEKKLATFRRDITRIHTKLEAALKALYLK
jgi:putative endonuclease